MNNAIGIFDSGYGGLTVMRSIVDLLPEYDYFYLGDNARAPYGSRSFDTVYHYTWQCVKWFFDRGSPLVILACNTASAKALRTIQQTKLVGEYAGKKVLGVIRPTTEILSSFTNSKEVGILATNGTVQSESYLIELKKFAPELSVHQEACPIWVPLVENNELSGEGTEFFVRKHLNRLLERGRHIDTILLACTHYPLLIDSIRRNVPTGIKVISQGEIVAASLKDYLMRHNEVREQCSTGGSRSFFTTDSAEDFNTHAAKFYGSTLVSNRIELDGYKQ